MCGKALKSKLASRGAHMKYTPKFLRGMLLSMIRKMGEHPDQYVRQPGRDFTRPPDADLRIGHIPAADHERKQH